MTDPAIELSGLTKFYGEDLGIRNVSLSVPRGEIFGFLGPNGAGKSTTIRALLDLIRPSSGTATVLGFDTQRDSVEVRRRVGYLPGGAAMNGKLTGKAFLEHMANLRGGTVEWATVDALVARFDVNMQKPIRELSMGNRQKIAIVQAFMHRPDVLILDEPTNGLDPLMQEAFNQLLRERQADGATIFLSSHNLPDVERVCERVGIIRDGELVTVEDVGALKRKAIRRIEVTFAHAVDPGAFRDLDGVRDMEVADHMLRCTVTGPLDALVKACAQAEVVDIRTEEPRLEEIFLALYGNHSHDPTAGNDAPEGRAEIDGSARRAGKDRSGRDGHGIEGGGGRGGRDPKGAGSSGRDRAHPGDDSP